MEDEDCDDGDDGVVVVVAAMVGYLGSPFS